MVPLWLSPFAIACGKASVLKAVEQLPLTQQIAFEWAISRSSTRRAEFCTSSD
jgi:hypothetical protein